MSIETEELVLAQRLAPELDLKKPESLDKMILLLLKHLKKRGKEKPFWFLCNLFHQPRFRFTFLSEEAHKAIKKRMRDTAEYVALWEAGHRPQKVREELIKRGILGGGKG